VTNSGLLGRGLIPGMGWDIFLHYLCQTSSVLAHHLV